MFRRVLFAGAVLSALLIVTVGQSQSAQAQEGRAFGQAWGNNKGAQNYDRFYHYPYVTYPQNYWGSAAYRSADSLYYCLLYTSPSPRDRG